MKKLSQIFCIVASVFLMVACTSSGNYQKVPREKTTLITNELKQGMTTAQVKTIMGEPVSSEFEKSYDCYVYRLYNISGPWKYTEYQLLFSKDQLIKINKNTACDSVIHNFKE